MIADSRNSDSGEYGKMEDEPEVFKVSSYLSEGRQESSEPFAFGRGETPTPIANVSLFKGSSNTGQPGSPHEYSNPGNPSGQQIPDFTPAKESIEEENLFKGSSNDGCAGHPHKHSNPGNPSIKDEVLRVESTTKHVVQPSESTSESEDPKPLKIEEKSEAEMEKTAVVGVEVKQEIPSTPTKEDTVVKKEKILPLMSQTVADLFGGEVTSGKVVLSWG